MQTFVNQNTSAKRNLIGVIRLPIYCVNNQVNTEDP